MLSWAGSEMDVGGFVIVDDSGEEVVLPEGPPLVPGQRALVVPSGFDASDARDVLPAPGTRLIRVEPRSLGSGGLRNGGERLELRDREGRVVSRAPAADLSRGDCLARVGAPDVDDPSAWQRRPCSPGAPP
ncbi:MAG: hypothetical protein IT379_21375 [Deltaproteobacteria bacterium]|nr:hypothetical protein [Deltaproteobacteria bacterium]